MAACLQWASDHPAAYWLPAIALFSALLASTLSIRGPASRPRTSLALLQSDWAFVLLVILTLAAFRWPVWFHAADQNPDEAQMISGALTLRQFPIFWKYVDGTTHGPLNDYLLTAASFIGIPLNFLGARIVATLLQAGALLLLWASVRPWIPERTARLAVMPGLAVWAFSTFHDLVQYSSENLTVTLLAAAVCCLSLAWQPGSPRRRRMRLGLCGLFLGMVPLAKLQGVPIAVAIAVIAMAAIWRNSAGRREGIAHFFWLVGGGLALPALTAVLLAVYGLIPQFMAAYVQSNLVYVDGAIGPGRMLNGFMAFMSVAPGFPVFAIGALAFALLFLWHSLGHPSSTLRFLLASAWAISLAALYAVVAPGREFPHYLHLLVIPLCGLAAIHLAAACSQPSHTGWQSPGMAVALFLVLTLAPQAIQRRLDNHPYLETLSQQTSRLISSPAQFILTHAQPGDTLTIWGWMPELHVETALPQGTRDAQTERMMNGGPMQEFYRERYLRDLIQRQPAWFVDAVGPRNFGYHDRDAFGHETVPALAQHIAIHYSQAVEQDGVRVYRRSMESASETVD